MRARRLDMCHGPIVMPMFRYTIPIFLADQLGSSGSDMVVAGGVPHSSVPYTPVSVCNLSHQLGHHHRRLDSAENNLKKQDLRIKEAKHSPT